MYYGNLQTKMSEEANMRAAIREAELNMLKSQINPHFLFNSLNSVSSLTVSNPQKAQNMIVKLSDYMRYMVSVKADQLTSFRAEFQNIERYLAIEHIRFGNRLIYEPVVQDLCLDFPIPSLILQPLFENAIKHGVHESTEPITISLRCTLVNGMLEVLIRNNFDPEGQIRKGTGIGLKNIADRLRLHYNSDNLLKIVKTETHFEVRLYFPSVIEKTEML
jgi:LytS/YehU family sensor histidine kinase